MAAIKEDLGEKHSSELDKETSGLDRVPSEEDLGIQSGSEKYKKLGWPKLTICLIVEAIALGSLTIPSVFATVGMVAGVILTVGIGLLGIYTSYVVGQVKLRYPEIDHYSAAVRLIWGKFGYELTGAMFVIYLSMVVGSHALTGTIAWVEIVNKDDVCALVFSIVSAIILFALALPPSFSEFAILGYIDFVSIIAAILITIIGTGVGAAQAPGGLAAVDWSPWPPADVTFYQAFLAATNIVFAYSFTVCQFSFMSEMHTPEDYVKAIWLLGVIEIFIYTLTGSLIYAFVGTAVRSPALLSASPTITRVAFGVALPVIFISGSINGTVVCRYIVDRAFPNSPIRYIKDKRGWSIWIALVASVTLFGWIVAEAIPFFSALLGLISALFLSGFSYYWPALFWFQLVKEGKWYQGIHNITLSIVNALVFIVGMAVLGIGTYAAAEDIKAQYSSGQVRSPFGCSESGYTS